MSTDTTEYIRTDTIPFEAIRLAQVELMKSRHRARRTGGHEAYQAIVDAAGEISDWLDEQGN